MTTDHIIELTKTVLPTLILIGGGQFILNWYEDKKRQREKEIDLIRAVREKQYASIERLYSLFATFIRLYRLSEPKTRMLNPSDDEARRKLLTDAIEAESQVDALIVRIGCEFGSLSGGDDSRLNNLLGILRQSVQKWRQTFRDGKALLFENSEDPDYLAFKESFVNTAAFMTTHYYSRLDNPKLDDQKAWTVVRDVFDNKREPLL